MNLWYYIHTEPLNNNHGGNEMIIDEKGRKRRLQPGWSMTRTATTGQVRMSDKRGFRLFVANEQGKNPDSTFATIEDPLKFIDLTAIIANTHGLVIGVMYRDERGQAVVFAKPPKKK